MTPIAPLLWVLLLLFLFRVVAQLVQWIHPLSWLPPFEVWHGAVLGYWQLLVVQVALLIWLFRIALRHTRGEWVAHRRVGQALAVLGGMYASAVLLRFAIGFFDLASSEWFDRPLPTFFHGVLAVWVLAVGLFHWQETSRQPLPK